jgi:hypothetical protein
MSNDFAPRGLPYAASWRRLPSPIPRQPTPFFTQRSRPPHREFSRASSIACGNRLATSSRSDVGRRVTPQKSWKLRETELPRPSLTRIAFESLLRRFKALRRSADSENEAPETRRPACEAGRCPLQNRGAIRYLAVLILLEIAIRVNGALEGRRCRVA